MAEAGKNKAVFLDRDGVINRALERDGKPYPPASIHEFEILPDVPQACRKLKDAGYLLIVATNQPDVGRGTIAKDVVELIHRRMCEVLPIDHVEVCYHGGGEEPPCACRKPRPRMLQHAARIYDIDLAKSWMVGDRWRDIDCGHAAGCQTIFIDRGYSEELRQKPSYQALDLDSAADLILRSERR